MYDLDSQSIAVKTKGCRGEMICCNPCVELWFLLHEKDQYASISTASCIQLLKSLPKWRNYIKGTLSDKQKDLLWKKHMEAVRRAKELEAYENPSAPIFRLIDLLEEKKENK